MFVNHVVGRGEISSLRAIVVWGILLVTSGICGQAWGADWPQYRGPTRNDISTETGLLQEWPSGGPKLDWTYEEAGIGYSGLAVVGGEIYTIGARGEQEFLIALEPAPSSGGMRERWATEIGPKFDFKGNNWSAGPSSTPTVDGDAIYALGGVGDLICVERATGKLRWKKNLPSDLEAQVNPIGGGPKNLGWGFTWSPLVDGNRLICVPGGPQGTLAALDKQTGELVWRSKELTDQAAYTSPTPAEFGGQRQFVVLTNQGICGVDARDGRVMWNYRRRFSTEVVNSPLVQGSMVHVTVGAGQGCELLKIKPTGDAFEVESVYANKNMANHHGNVVYLDGHVYGFSEGKGWVCQSIESGELVWAERRPLAAGSLTYADGRIYAFSENDGTVVLWEPSTNGWKENGRFKLPKLSTARKPSGRIWTPPVVSGGKLYLRDQELIYAYDVSRGA